MFEIPAYADIRKQQGQTCALRYLVSERSDEIVQQGVLVEVGERFEQRGYERFSLLIHAVESCPPRQGMYAVTLPGMQVQQWFLVPIAREGDRIVYEACFNRAASTA